MITLHLLLSLGFVYALLSFVEYVGHRWVLHKMRLARYLGSRLLKEMCHNHMVLHHGREYRHREKRRDDQPAQLAAVGLVVGVLAALIVYPIDPLTVKILAVSAVVYAPLAWEVHNEMHRARGRFYSKWRLFLYLEEKQRQHHLHPDTNFNVLLPLWDWVFSRTGRLRWLLAW